MVSRRGIYAFTLIELLVVIGIIVVLAAILFPVFGSAREKARQTVCLSNERQIGLGIAQYVQDFDDIMPHQQFFNGSNWSTFRTWEDAVDPYLKSHDVYRCPSNPYNTVRIAGGKNGETFPISYAPNEALMPGWSQTWSTSMAAIDDSSDTVAVVESRAPWSALSANNIIYGNALSDWQGGNYPAGTQQPSAGQGEAFEHQHFINVIFADDHAKATKFAHTIAPADMWMTSYECGQDPGQWFCGWGQSQGYFNWAAVNAVISEYQ